MYILLSIFISKYCFFLDGSRRSAGKGKKLSLHAGLISKPQNDLRHTGHVGFDGALFGDVSFIGDNYDKLPVKVVNPCKYNNFSFFGRFLDGKSR